MYESYNHLTQSSQQACVCECVINLAFLFGLLKLGSLPMFGNCSLFQIVTIMEAITLILMVALYAGRVSSNIIANYLVPTYSVSAFTHQYR